MPPSLPFKIIWTLLPMSIDPSCFLNSPLGNAITQTQLNDALLSHGHWQARYRYLMTLGLQLPELAPEWRTDDALVAGCESASWLHHLEYQGHHFWLADSEARIVRGLLVLVLAAYNGKTQAQIAEMDLTPWFQQLGLSGHLSPSRSNGLYAVIRQIQQTAALSG